LLKVNYFFGGAGLPTFPPDAGIYSSYEVAVENGVVGVVPA